MNFYNDAITKECRQGIAILRGCDFMKDFYLAGGTALALQIGHRISTDLDMFSQKNPLGEIQRTHIHQVLKSLADIDVVSEQDGLLYTRLNETDTSFIYQHHALLESFIDFEGIQLAAPVDIGLMKLAAINSRGTRRDFVDIFCLRNLVSLETLFNLAPEKYPDRSQFLAVAVRALSYFEDAEQEPMPRMLIPIEWQAVRDYCEDASKKMVRRLSGLD